MNDTKLIRLETSPVIDYRGIEGISQLVDKRIAALNLDKQVATEDTVKTLKEIRASLNKEFKEYEDQRKAIKTAVIDPYSKFEEEYKKLISNKYTQADMTLKEKIYSVEDRIKKDKEEKIQSYFDEYCRVKEIDFLKFSQVGVNVTLSASEKSLKEDVNRFVDDVKKDVDAINIVPGDSEFRTEILIEYKKTLDILSAIETVNERIKQKEAIKKAKEEILIPKDAELTHTPLPEKEVLSAPAVESEQKVFTVNFSATGTIEQLRRMKQFMVENKITFKNI